MKIYLVMRAFVSPGSAGACSFVLSAYYLEGDARDRIYSEDFSVRELVPSRIHWMESVDLIEPIDAALAAREKHET